MRFEESFHYFSTFYQKKGSFKISPGDNLPLPNHSIQSIHPAAAPGTVQEFIFVYGIEFSVIPNLSRAYSSVNFDGDLINNFSNY